MNPHHIWALYLRELRAALRERSIVVNSILLPIFLYPVILWLTFTGLTFVQGVAEGYVSRVAVFDVPAVHDAVLDSLESAEGVELRDDFASADDARAAVRREQLDAVLEFVPPDPEAGELEDNFRVEISFDRSENRSQQARDRLASVVDGYRDRWLEAEGRELGLGSVELVPMRIAGENVSTGGEMGAFVLSEIVPVLLVVMVALGCFIPAIDSTAGERERGTWETLMTVSASRTSIVTAKYLYVATFGTVAGILNVLAITISLGAILGPLLGGAGAGVDFEYPALAVPVMILGAVILALFFAAAMMILATFARTFRDGQSMTTPVYWLAMIPILLGQAPDANLSWRLALVPIVNVVLMMRDAIQGVFAWPLILESFLVGLIVVTACLAVARWILSFEDVLIGSYDGSFWRFVRKRAGR